MQNKSAVAQQNEYLDELDRHGRLRNWSEFAETLQVPGELIPAFGTGRAELMRMVPPRDLTAAECKVLYDLIGGLLETNAALRAHAAELAKLMRHWNDNFKGQHKLARRIEHFANFRRTDEGDDDEE